MIDQLEMNADDGEDVKEEASNDHRSKFLPHAAETFDSQAPVRDEIRKETRVSSQTGGGGDEVFITQTVESEYEKRESGGRGRIRFLIVLLGLSVAVVNCYAQATFCIAIVEMVIPADLVVNTNPTRNNNSNVEKQQAGETSANNWLRADQFLERDQSCPIELKYRDYYDNWRFSSLDGGNKSSQLSGVKSDGNDNKQVIMSNRFDWDAGSQGLLLGAFAVGLAPLQVLGGRLAEIYGAKWVLLAACLGTAITNLAIPLFARVSFVLLLINRVIMGVAQAGTEPGLMCLMAEWLSPLETGFFISMLLFATCIGYFFGSLCSSFLLTLGYDWSITYYVAGGINLLVSIVWFIYSNSSPKDSKFISKEELSYIEFERKQQQVVKTSGIEHDGQRGTKTNRRNSGIHFHTSTSKIDNIENISTNNQSNDDQPLPRPFKVKTPLEAPIEARAAEETQHAPWGRILSSRSVWAFIICKVSIRWCADVLTIELPTYLANVLHLSIKLNGILNSLSTALFAIFSFITGYLVNEILKGQQTHTKGAACAVDYDDTTENDFDNTNNSKSNDYDDHSNSNSNSNNNAKQQQQILTAATSISDKRKENPDRRSSGISKTHLRKIFQSVASFGSAICMFLMTRYDCNIVFSTSMLLLLSCCLVMGTGGEFQIPNDMTFKYPGTLHGMACSLSVSGWLAPPLIGLILGEHPSSRYRWNIVWNLTALINLIGGLVFVLFADARPRDFDYPSAGRDRRATSSDLSGDDDQVGDLTATAITSSSATSITHKDRNQMTENHNKYGRDSMSSLSDGPLVSPVPNGQVKSKDAATGDQNLAGGRLNNSCLHSLNGIIVFPFKLDQQVADGTNGKLVTDDEQQPTIKVRGQRERRTKRKGQHMESSLTPTTTTRSMLWTRVWRRGSCCGTSVDGCVGAGESWKRSQRSRLSGDEQNVCHRMKQSCADRSRVEADASGTCDYEDEEKGERNHREDQHQFPGKSIATRTTSTRPLPTQIAHTRGITTITHL